MFTIKIDDLTHHAVQTLVAYHISGMLEQSPPESSHALNVQKLRDPAVTFWSAWEGEQLAGIGALKMLDAKHGELKSMRTAEAFLSVLKKAGVAFAALGDEPASGSSLGDLMGFVEDARAQARKAGEAIARTGAKTLIVREVYNDWETEERGLLWIERVDTVGRPAAPLTSET